MSRLMAAFVALLYATGGLVTGYYGYALRLEAVAAENGLVPSLLLEFTNSNYILGGIVMLLFAITLHFLQIGKARRVDYTHVEKESGLKQQVNDNECRINELESTIAENANIVEFCRTAIHQSVTPKTDEQPKDYAE